MQAGGNVVVFDGESFCAGGDSVYAEEAPAQSSR